MILAKRFEKWRQKLIIFSFYGRLWAIAQCFGVPTQFLNPMTLSTRYDKRRQKLSVFSFYGHFGVPVEISKTNETWYTILGSRGYF
jgi:hypothetical protein